MRPKPAHLGPQYGEQFSDPAVVGAYHHRPPYPEETFDILLGLISGEPRVVLDLGCGPGSIARGLVARVDRVDAVDLSPGMIELGKTLPGGRDPRLRWTCAPAETAAWDPPYTLVTAAASLHWMAWDVVMPRIRDAL